MGHSWTSAIYVYASLVVNSSFLYIFLYLSNIILQGGILQYWISPTHNSYPPGLKLRKKLLISLQPNDRSNRSHCTSMDNSRTVTCNPLILPTSSIEDKSSNGEPYVIRSIRVARLDLEELWIRSLAFGQIRRLICWWLVTRRVGVWGKRLHRLCSSDEVEYTCIHQAGLSDIGIRKGMYLLKKKSSRNHVHRKKIRFFPDAKGPINKTHINQINPHESRK